MNTLLDQFSILQEYWDIADKIEKTLNDICKKNFNNFQLPINLNLVAKEFGFTIKRDVDTYNIYYYGDIFTECIHISNNISYKEQRWVIAEAMAMHHLGIKGTVYNPFLVKSDIDMVPVDIIATFILLPISLFKKDLSQYIANTNCFNGNRYLEHLSNCSQIPMFHLSFCYLINLMLCFQRQTDFKDSGYDVMAFQEEDKKNRFINIFQ